MLGDELKAIVITFKTRKRGDGSYYVHCPDLATSGAEGKTKDEALDEAIETTEILLKTYLEQGFELQQGEYLRIVEEKTISLSEYSHTNSFMFMPNQVQDTTHRVSRL